MVDKSEIIPLYYVGKGRMDRKTIFQRPVRNDDNIAMGFAVCDVRDGIDPAEVCAILNKGDPATEA